MIRAALGPSIDAMADVPCNMCSHPQGNHENNWGKCRDVRVIPRPANANDDLRVPCGCTEFR